MRGSSGPSGRPSPGTLTGAAKLPRVSRPRPEHVLSTRSSSSIPQENTSIKTIVLSWLGTTYLKLVGATSRIIWVNRTIREDLEKTGEGFVYAFWHGRQAFLAYLHAGDDIRPLISQSRDGELIARICQAFGMNPIRGSTSRGGTEALIEIKSAIESGNRVGFTPDGPKGPLYKVQPGVLYAAQKTGCSIVPVAYGSKKSWVFGSWDRFMVPKPFTKIAMVYGEPLTIGADDDLDKRAIDLKLAIDAVTREADSIAGASCCD
jgi:lysophospholipid acyltransferase (LPLAT)-like uncharacterized protein